MPLKSNDHVGLSPSFPKARRVLEFELPSVEIGVAEYVEGPTGCTVLYFPQRARCAIDVRGGSPVWLGDYGWTDAVCLSGGSAYGLEAAVGVGAELLAQTDYSPEWDDIALVSGAVIFDLGTRDNIIYPDKALGRAALRSRLTGRFPLGRHGAGEVPPRRARARQPGIANTPARAAHFARSGLPGSWSLPWSMRSV